jgi:hypothetical protein
VEVRNSGYSLGEAVPAAVLDRAVGLDAPDIGPGKNQLVEGNALRLAQDDGRLGFSHGVDPPSSETGDRNFLLASKPVTHLPPPPVSVRRTSREGSFSGILSRQPFMGFRQGLKPGRAKTP